MEVALIPGSFDPIHNGHLHLGHRVLEETETEEVWYVLSPQSPFKVDRGMENELHRLEMVKKSLNNDKFKVCDIELSMDRPSLTFRTLEKLEKLYPDNNFHIVMGSDVANSIPQWEGYDELSRHPLITFKRDDEEVDIPDYPSNIVLMESDISLSSTDIRGMVLRGESLDGLLQQSVIDYIYENNLYTDG